jgi:hypothetical protein
MTPRARDARGAGAVDDAGHLVEQLNHALGSGRRLEDRVRERAQVPHRTVQLRQVRDEHEEAADREIAARDRNRAQHDNEHDAQQLDDVDQGREQPANAGGGQLGVDDPLVLALEALELRVLAVRGLDQHVVAEALLSNRAKRAGAAPLLARGLLDQPREAARNVQEDGSDHERHERQAPVQVDQRAREEDDAKQRGQPVGHSREDEALDGLHVPREPRDHVAQAAPVERVERELLHVREEAPAHALQEALPQPGGEVVVAERDQPIRNREGEVERHDPCERLEVAGHEHLVDDELEHPDLGRLDRRADGDQQEADGDPPPVRARVGPEAAEDLPDGHGRGLGHERALARGHEEPTQAFA